MSYKVDVAVQSYKKPESLIYSLLSLHRHCRDEVDRVWINDDKSGGNILDIYNSSELKDSLYPWRIEVRENQVRMGWWLSFVRGYKPHYLSYPNMLIRMLRNFYKNRSFFVQLHDLRYQWAIENTDKEYLFLMHDDIFFKKNIIEKYCRSIAKLKKPAIVGDLGQCWRCSYYDHGCSPTKVKSGYRPGANWPNTRIKNGDHQWACRINEWSALLSISAARSVKDKHRLFFGNYDNKGDISAYWFATAISEGFDFDDPVNYQERNDFYLHAENGVSGHSVWVDQGNGKSSYDKFSIRKRLKDEFKFDWAWD